MVSAPRIQEIECLCGARERDDGQTVPRRCWSCGKDEMGRFGAARMEI